MELNPRDFMYKTVPSELFDTFEKKFKEEISNNELDFNLYSCDVDHLNNLAYKVENQPLEIDYSDYEALC